MPAVDWYNANRNRAFPFLKGAAGDPLAGPSDVEALPDDLVVDAGFVAGLGSGFVAGEHRVYLARVTRSGSFLVFEFRSDAPGLWNRPLTFTRLLSDPPYAVEYADNFDNPAGVSESSDSLFSLSEACPPEPLWYGHLVTGRFETLAALLPSGESLTPATDAGGTVEPALVQNLAASYVASVNLANDDRTRVDAPPGCVDVGGPGFPTGRAYVSARCLRGDVRFKAGFNAVVRQEADANLLALSADAGAGEGPACEEVPLFDGEGLPDGSTLLGGGPRCDEVLRSVNGVGGRFLTIFGGPGVRVTPVPDQHKVVLSVDMDRLAVCVSESLTA